MSPKQIQQLAKLMVNDPEIMSILKGDDENVERGIQERIPEGVRPRGKTKTKVVGGVVR